MKLLLTGGHTGTALAIIEEIKSEKRFQDIDLVFIGRRYATDSEKTDSLEYQEVINHGVPFYHLSAGRLNRFFSLRSLIQILKIPLGFYYAYKIVSKVKPDIILAFGGYIGLPVAFAGWLYHIPVYGHEQTMSPGLANRLASPFYTNVFVSFAQSSYYFPDKKVIVSGNPVRKTILKEGEKPFKTSSAYPVLYITGGSLGSHSINIHIKEIIGTLLERYTVIHQTGNIQEFHDYESLCNLKTTLSLELQSRYHIVKHINTEHLGFVYSKADLVIGRCGANTFFELVALQKPALLIPLPWSAHQEQQKQAEMLQKAGCAEIVKQQESSKVLLEKIHFMMNNLSHYTQNYTSLTHLYTHDVTAFILETISSKSP